jgi:hypothetical protein
MCLEAEITSVLIAVVVISLTLVLVEGRDADIDVDIGTIGTIGSVGVSGVGKGPVRIANTFVPDERDLRDGGSSREAKQGIG